MNLKLLSSGNVAGGLWLLCWTRRDKGGRERTHRYTGGWGRRKGEHTQCGEMARGLREEVMSEWGSKWIESEP